MTSKGKAIKMVQHTHYDRATKKFVKTMVPESHEHADRSKRIDKALAKHKEPSAKEKLEHQSRIGRAYSE